MQRLERTTGGDISMNPPAATHKWRLIGDPPFLPNGDYFSYVASLALQQIPRTFVHPLGVLFRQDIQIHENWYGRYYEITVPYGREKKEQEGAYQITVDQTGGTVNVKAGTRIAGYGEEDDKVDNGGLIGVDGDEVRGVDIPVEEGKINVTFRHPEGALNRAYIIAVGRLVGFPNEDPFLGYEPGEVLYLGGSFTESNTEATAAYSFAISYNRTNFDVGGITVVEKKGWDVLSPTYKKVAEDDHVVQKLAYIEIIRPAGREWKPYASTFGWGGTG